MVNIQFSFFETVLIEGVVLIVFASPLWTPVLVWRLRKDHPHQIYIIWYAFSFFFVLFFFLFLAAGLNHVRLEEIFGESRKETVALVLHYLQDAEAEIKMVLAVVGLVILPQWLTYFLSGLSGSASPPVFISQITEFAIWSLVKFSAALAGFVLAGPAAKWFVDLDSIGNFDIFTEVSGIALLGLGFFLVWMNTGTRRIIDFLHRQKVLSSLRRIDEFFTRFSRDGSQSIPRREIEVLSD